MKAVARKPVEVVDKKTGEVMQADFIVLAPENVDTSFCKIFLPVIEELFRDEVISKNAIRLLLFMISKLDFNNLEVVMSTKEACEKLRVHRSTLQRWKAILIKKGFIVKKPGYNDVYILRPHSVIRGSMYKVDHRQLQLFRQNATAIA